MKEDVNISLKTEAPDEYNKLNIILRESTPVPGTGAVAPMTGVNFLINNIEIESEFYHINDRKPNTTSGSNRQGKISWSYLNARYFL